MKPQFHSVFLLISLYPLSVRSDLVHTSGDSLVDVLPLSVGNQWTYHYFTDSGSWPGGNPGWARTDSGCATLSIVGRTIYLDSTSWLFQQERDLIVRVVYSSLGEPDRDTSYAIRDTSYFDLIESRLGQHQVYRNADPYLSGFDVFPFTRNFTDTTMVYRFRQVVPGDTITFLSWIYPKPAPTFQSNFTFKKNVGLTRYLYNAGTVDAWSRCEHFLLNSVITSVAQDLGLQQAASFYLFQNYPNPFNPTTTIEYFTPVYAPVTLKVFDLLGQEIATLVDEIAAPGYKSIRLNASNLTSGLYFYQLRFGSFVVTRKALLVK